MEQVSVLLKPGIVITVQERPGDCLEPLRRRIRDNKGRVRQAGADYLAYAVIDAIVDNYYPVLDRYGEHLEELESELLVSTASDDNTEIHATKQDLYALRRALWPLREMLGTVVKASDDHFDDETRKYLRDCHDHAGQLLDIVDACREMSSSLMDLHLAGLSQRMNEVMKVLTLIATIFIPLSFIAGLYGMNFDRETSPWNMPELGWRFGYVFALGVMLVTAVGFLVYFRRKGWLGRTRRPTRTNGPSASRRDGLHD